MKITQKLLTAYVRYQLANNPAWAIRALVRIHAENQTPSERAMGATVEDNGIGFSGADAEFLSSLAQSFARYGNLTAKQTTFVLRIMPRYSRQVIAMADRAKLEAGAMAYAQTQMAPAQA